MKTVLLYAAALSLSLVTLAGSIDAKGCLKGAVAGGAAGHYTKPRNMSASVPSHPHLLGKAAARSRPFEEDAREQRTGRPGRGSGATVSRRTGANEDTRRLRTGPDDGRGKPGDSLTRVCFLEKSQLDETGSFTMASIAASLDSYLAFNAARSCSVFSISRSRVSITWARLSSSADRAAWAALAASSSASILSASRHAASAATRSRCASAANARASWSACVADAV